ncbi:MAG: protein-export chaperone SecB [Alphaproteobacteria bacterium]|nr:protein-export chaperone SecB [Alphaproteobacteria bacterium]
MADTKKASNAAPTMPVTFYAQYVRDLSFENPKAPETLRVGQTAPQMGISLNMDSRKLGNPQIPDLHEVIMRLRATAKRDEETVFVVEIEYGITVSLNGAPEEFHKPLLFIEVPKLAFPYIRKILADMAVNGGYPPIMLQPIDFYAMYVAKNGQPGKNMPQAVEQQAAAS